MRRRVLHNIQQGANYIYPLDIVNNPQIAYSFRRLSSTYSGSLIRVIRDSDSTETDIPFKPNGLLNETILTNFSMGGDVFVVKWYDQSGNGNDFIPSAYFTSRPIIVSSGTIRKNSAGFVSAGFGINGTSNPDIFVTENIFSFSEATLFQNRTLEGEAANKRALAFTANGAQDFANNSKSASFGLINLYIPYKGINVGATTTANSMHNYSFIISSTEAKMYKDNNLLNTDSSINTNTITPDFISYGGQGVNISHALIAVGGFGDLIMYNYALDATDFNDINSAITDYYGFYTI